MMAAWQPAARVSASALALGFDDEADEPLEQAVEADAIGAGDVAERPAQAAGVDDGRLQALLARVVERDERAFAALYDATASRVQGLVRRIVRIPALAEEVVEDAYWQVWRQAPRYEAGRGRVLTWLLSIARSRAIDALRRDERHEHDELAADASAEPAAAGAPAEELIEASRGAQRVHEALARLDARSRQLVALAFLRGLTHDEIAAQTGMPLGSVKSLIRRALLRLRELIEQPGRCLAATAEKLP